MPLRGRRDHWLRHGRRVRSIDDDLGSDPRALPGLLRGARPPAAALRLAGAAARGSLRAADDGGDAAAEALLPWARSATRVEAHQLPEVLPHARHREGRLDAAASDVLRDAGALLDRRVLQAGRDR